MKKNVPAKEVEFCDFCLREMDYLVTCKACGARHCLSCRAIIAGCIHQVDVCRSCGENAQVLAIVFKHAPLIKEALLARDAEISEAFQHRVQPTGGMHPSNKRLSQLEGDTVKLGNSKPTTSG